MKLIVCCVFDSAVKAYVTPFFSRSKGEAARSFSDAVNGQKSNLSEHPADFTLMYLGEWSDETGEFYGVTPSKMFTGLEVKVDPASV